MSILHYLETKPRKHQEHAIEKMRGKSNFALFMGVGTGKTWLALNRMTELYMTSKSQHAIIVAPSGVQKQWVYEELPKHAPPGLDYSAVVFENTAKGSKAVDALLAVPGLKILAVNIEAVSTKAGHAAIMKMLRASRNQAMIFLDESHLIKTPGAKRTRAMWQFARYSSYRLIMTGTPIAKNILDTYAQYKFLDHRILNMTRVEDFKSRYCEMAFTPYGMEIVGTRNLEDFQEKVEPYTFRISAVPDLPPQVFLTRTFELSSEQRRLIREIKDTWQAEHAAGRATVKTGATAQMRIQQISNGFLVDENDNVIRLDNPRLGTLKDLLSQIDGKVIIWCRFHYDVEQVCRMLGEESMHYYGLTEEADRDLAKRSFLDPHSGINYLVATPDSMGTGLNLQGLCHHNIYYSNSFNSVHRWQSEGRTWRDGTTDTVFYIDLVAAGSADRGILRNLKLKKDTASMTLEDYGELFRLTEEASEGKVISNKGYTGADEYVSV